MSYQQKCVFRYNQKVCAAFHSSSQQTEQYFDAGASSGCKTLSETAYHQILDSHHEAS